MDLYLELVGGGGGEVAGFLARLVVSDGRRKVVYYSEVLCAVQDAGLDLGCGGHCGVCVDIRGGLGSGREYRRDECILEKCTD